MRVSEPAREPRNEVMERLAPGAGADEQRVTLTLHAWLWAAGWEAGP